MASSTKAAAVVLLGVFLASCGTEPPPETVFAVKDFRAESGLEPRSRCKQYSDTRSAHFGDLHVHTAVSSDAFAFDVRVSPDDAYGYAFGEPAYLALGDDFTAREVRIDRPLDFAAVTDHAEFLGEGEVCTDPSAEGYNTRFCAAVRSGEGRAPELLMRIMLPWQTRDSATCGDDGERCAVLAENLWQQNIATAEKWNSTDEDCERTAFVAYEYSSVRLGSNLHRNVIFRNAIVPQRPISYLEAIREWDLWRILKEQCIDGSAQCDVLAIPHNSNISNGRMFAVDYPGADTIEEQAARARLRMEIEPIVEIMQHKGDSECRNGLDGVLGVNDELCEFEKFAKFAALGITGTTEPDTCYEGEYADWKPNLGPSCRSRNSYVRYALVEGMKEEERIGVNPFKLGLSASTDTHNGLAGGVQEKNFPGHLGNGDSVTENRVQFNREFAGNASNNAGGLIGIWAEENSRDSLFDGMRRKEVFGTSGPRIEPRFFGSWDMPENLCGDPAMIERAYAEAVPMGSDLPEKTGTSPQFLVAATADAGSMEFPGNPLQQLQVIKGWSDAEGNIHQSVFEVAGDAANGASVDLNSCAPQGQGFAQLCSVWQDPEFDENQRAVYYLRAVENPSCRYTAWQCLSLPEDERPEDCATPLFDPVIQERAWSSPIWYSPT
jgi:hypothetical protein